MWTNYTIYTSIWLAFRVHNFCHTCFTSFCLFLHVIIFFGKFCMFFPHRARSLSPRLHESLCATLRGRGLDRMKCYLACKWRVLCCWMLCQPFSKQPSPLEKRTQPCAHSLVSFWLHLRTTSQPRKLSAGRCMRMNFLILFFSYWILIIYFSNQILS